ncbi:hypothetical protein CKN82_12305 [Carnobacterium divergens]|uniref:hypothetical protein n=1 Tax=Carnobacterium divergens TaxID=2748 RepID=UPI001071A6CF|nr:hypothetical protein [Carnobacterium divergens]TFI66277.1 hypothetical protein CKN70_12460 [Carnobacterium divergens]TFI77699.1 hypothetical protein CKN68_12420 [Carnobacterium divergens]TFI85903.1 hypothetical protein CKN72_12185 [Carnobacterium divergens]TFI94912.1 hypothetical protein CKN67_12425 [Carnobacterium divergens]TFI95704.1 hypothetical protein CKN82_12305 [Carnobacterium divergens]
MKKKLVTGAVIMIVGGSLCSVPAIAKPDTSSLIENRFKIKREKMMTQLNQVLSRVDVEVKETIKEKIAIKEEALVKAEEEAQARATQEQAQQVANEQAAQEQQAAVNTQQTTPVEPNEQSASSVTPEATTGVSQNNWQERSNKGREYGERLSDPNLSQDERRNIVEEKKNYFRNGR